jgi:hypothetical protein
LALLACAGLPARPVITAASSSATQASVTFGAVHTATSYSIQPLNQSAVQGSAAAVEGVAGSANVFATPDDLPTGVWSFEITATNGNGDGPLTAVSRELVLGLPEAPSVVDVTTTYGTATLRWTAPEINAVIGTRYSVQLYRGDNDVKFGNRVLLQPSGDGSEDTPFSATLNVTAGSWKYQIFTTNVNGEGAASSRTDAVDSRAWRLRPACLPAVGLPACLPACLLTGLACLLAQCGWPLAVLACPTSALCLLFVQCWLMHLPLLVWWATPPR